MTGRFSALTYVPRRNPLQLASLGPVALYLGVLLVVCFLSADPIVLAAATGGAAIAGILSGAGRAVRFSFRIGGILLLTMIVVNALVTSRGETVLARLGTWPLLGRVDVTAEAIAAGAVIGMRALGTMVVIGVWSACVDPDRVLHAAHGLARRSALTATLITRLVPLAAGDYSRLGEAARLRGPAAAPVTRPAMAGRLLAGSLDRAVDVAATLELRGYSLEASPAPNPRRRSRYDRRFVLAGIALTLTALALAVTGAGGLVAYPRVIWELTPATIFAALVFLASGLVACRRNGAR